MQHLAVYFGRIEGGKPAHRVASMLQACLPQHRAVSVWSHPHLPLAMGVAGGAQRLERTPQGDALALDGHAGPLDDPDGEPVTVDSAQPGGTALFAAIQAHGPDALRLFHGAFAGIAWREADAELLLFRDPMGERPLFVAAGPGWMAAASHVCALETLPELDRAIDRDAVASYLHFGVFPAPLTIYRQVCAVTSASTLSLSAPVRGVVPTLSPRRYWDPTPALHLPPLSVGIEEAADLTQERLCTILDRRIPADGGFASFLSSGIDSSTLSAIARARFGERVTAVTVGFDDASADESLPAKALARHLDVRHLHTVLTPAQAIALTPRLIDWYGQPFADNAAVPTFVGMQLASEAGATVLTGAGADVVFCGTRIRMRLDAAYRRWSWLGKPFRLLPRGVRPTFDVFRESYRERLTAWAIPWVLALTGRWPHLPEFNAAWAAAGTALPSRRATAVACKFNLPSWLTVKDECTGRAAGVEPHGVYMDRTLVDLTMRFPDDLTRHKGVLRHLAARYFPAALLNRRKAAFAMPLARWFAGEMEPMLMDLVTPDRLRPFGIRNFVPVRRLLHRRHRLGINGARKLWILLVLSLWGSARLP